MCRTVGGVTVATGVEVRTTYKCEECPDEPVTMETEKSYQVSCFISQEVKYMQTALRKVSVYSYRERAS